jgi:hypothetical protein
MEEAGMTTSTTDTGPFPQADLAVNAGGRLSDDQRRAWRSMSRGYRRSELECAVVAVVIGALVTFAPGPAKDATIKPIIGLVCLVIAVLLLVRAFTGGDRLSEDVRAGRVESVEGAITKYRNTSTGGRGSGLTSYYFDVSGKRLEVSHSGYEVAPDAGYVRLFYLPKSRRVINFERLPDPPAPELTSTNVQEVVRSVAAGVHSHDENAAAEARAQMAAMGAQFRSQLQQAAVPPPPDQRDARPLAEGIVGTWTSAFMTVAFAADGTVTSTMPNGRQMAGRWSIDAQGHLHAGIAGHDNVGDAWVVGNTLTVSEGGMGLSFERTG